MSGFFAALGRNLLALPANLRAGLRPLPLRADEPRVRIRRSFVYHLHPRTVTERALDPRVSLWLGTAAATLFGALCLSGALLMIYYQPSIEAAHPSMLDIEHAVTFGAFVRAVHRWAAHAMVLLVGLHLVRVVAQAAYRGRELNWFIGLGLLGLSLGLAFTGYLLPWDQRSYWAVTVSAGLLDHLPLGGSLKQLFLGGADVGAATLLRFYMLHVALLPTGLLLLLGLHLWRIRRDGGLAVSPVGGPPPPAEVPAWPHLVLREAIVVLSVLAAVALVSVWLSAPLGAPPDPHHPSNPEKAPWYFVWLQEMVSYSATVGGLVYPLVVGLLLAGLPFLDREDQAVGRWFGLGRVRWSVGAGLLVGLVGFTGLCASTLGPPAAGGPPGWNADLLNPAAGMLVLALAAFLLAGVASGSTRAACLAALAVLTVGLCGCLVLGLCRGPDWVLYWPWEAWPDGA